MTRRTRERRRASSELITRPRSSPATLLILTILGVLGVSAAATVVMDRGFENVTPHGQVLGQLQEVAEAQERHYAETGAFATWVRTLDIATTGDVRVTLLHGGVEEWEAVAHHPVGLACTQSGRVRDGIARADRPTCFTTEP